MDKLSLPITVIYIHSKRYGEEIARCLLKASLAKLGPSAISKTLSDCNPLRSVPFDGIFEGEGNFPVSISLDYLNISIFLNFRI